MWIAYVLVIYLTHLAPWPKFPLLAAAICTVLIPMGFVLSPTSGLTTSLTILNRVLGIFLIWLAAYIVFGWRKALDEWRDSEGRHQRLVEVLPDAVLINTDNRITYCNSASLRLFGASAPNDLLGKSPLLFFDPQYHEVIRNRIQAMLDGNGSVSVLEEEVVRLDGRAIPVEVVATAISHRGKRSILVVLHDLSQRKQTEENLRLLIEGVKEYAIFLLDPSGKVIHWNSGAERIFGYPAGEVIGTSFSQFFPPADVTSGQPQAELKEAATVGHFDAVGWRVRKDGTRFWANGTLTALYNDQGKIRGYAKITRDLTEQHRLELLLRSILDYSVDSIICIDEQGRIETFNRTAEEAFGYSQAEVIGKNVNMLMPEPHHSQHDLYIANYLRTGVARIIGTRRDVDALRKDGSTFPADLSVTEFQAEVDGSRHFTGMIRDLTDRRALEAQLRHSQKMEAFGQLAGGVAHDFNNLLTVISGFSELVLEELPRNDPNRGLLEQVRDAGERATSLTRQLLAFSRQQVLEPKVLDLNTVVHDTEKLLRRLIGEDVNLAAVLAPNLRSVKVDPGQFEQVIINLALNARDAMPRGGQLTIETQNIDLDEEYEKSHFEARRGRCVLLAVSDTGTGMPPEVKSRVFEPFFTTKGVGKGTGLGLAVVHGIIKQSGGSIEVYSEVGAGTTFKIYLPAVEETDANDSPVRPQPAPGTETILLAEDEEAVRAFAVLALQNYGYHVLPAASGQDALQLAEDHEGRIDLLLTDVVMPGMSGTQLAEVLRARCPDIQVLYLSGYMDDAVVRHGILQHDVAFLQKPFTPASLARKVREVLEQ